MQIAQENQNPKNKVKNTFSTDSSKRQNQIEHDQNFKSERQKYLQQRLNRRKQIKQVRKQKFGSSSSESQKSTQKPKFIPKIIKDFEVIKPSNVVESNNKNQEEQFHAKHQAYIREKMARKQQLIEQKKKQFGSSSSDSDDDLVVRKMDGLKMQSVVEVSKQGEDLQVPKQGSRVLPVKRSLGSTSNDNNTRTPIIVQQIVYTKGEKAPQSKKLTILVQSKKNLQWIQETLVIENKRIKLLNQNIQLLIGYITKIKLLFTSVSKDYLKMKLSLKDQDYFFGVSSKKLIDNLPEYYYLFAKVIQQKLIQIGFEPKKNQSSIFPNYQNLRDAPMWLKNNSIVFANILKKSQILGNWETRFIYIAEKQIGSGKRPIDKPSMVIQTESILGLWTRFDIENNNMLNIKIMYNTNTKTEFGIPISNFTDENNWLYSFYRVIKNRA